MDGKDDEGNIPIGDLKAFIRKSIDEEQDEDSKVISAMLLMFMEYADYVQNIDKSLHERAMSFATEMHGLKSISFSIEKVEIERGDPDESVN